MKDLIERLLANKVERISFERGVTAGRSHRPHARRVAARRARAAAGAHLDISRTSASAASRLRNRGKDGIASDMAAIRQLYTNAVSAAETAWESAAAEGKPDVPAALNAVEGLADAVTQNRTALVALTAMRNYDNYTFTHMVNVSILTMGQARALGIEGRLLREFGLSALMHDIGKVRTPKEILQKPERLTDEEFVIMRRHPVEGAEILRRTPEMPILAPVVAFEHHLRLDGTGYPDGAKRDALNLGTMICSIADVYDAMRSQRAYQQAFPTDRVLAVLKKDDGAHFDAAAGAPLRAAARHLSAGHARQARIGRGRGRHACPRAGSVPAARQSAAHGPMARATTCRSNETCGSARPTVRPPTASSRRSIRRTTGSIR